ncbi:helix-turn-helix transcriptional regulator [Antrihabitans sp. NCIMB 15449]|jgi:transcriptional regulator with XRE-family HTH domain|uniref:Helix-turn-helix transcriptional regulator n=1 Tax=Antrihabitans spumae TaxID=3373370 RepID=A0ABW7JM96_9NOCA
MPRKEEGSLEWATYGYSFAERLKWIRAHRKISQEKLAELSGMHRNQISNLERNTSRERDSSADPHLSTVYELARALNVAPELLLPDTGRVPSARSAEHRGDTAFAMIEVDLTSALRQVDSRRLQSTEREIGS